MELEQNQKLKDEIKNLIKENEKLHHKNKQIEIKFKAQIQNMVNFYDYHHIEETRIIYKLLLENKLIFEEN